MLTLNLKTTSSRYEGIAKTAKYLTFDLKTKVLVMDDFADV